VCPRPDDPIQDDEVLLRRIPPSRPGFNTIERLPGGGFRAASITMSTRRDEDALSCSRLKRTSPRRLLDILRIQGIDPAGWSICKFYAADVRELGLQIEVDPTSDDEGHCGISTLEGLAYPKKKAKQLARRTRILTEDEIEELSKTTPPDPPME
jgi:hypothetical protein